VAFDNNVLTAAGIAPDAFGASELAGDAAAEIGDTSLNKDTLAAPYIYEIYTEDTTGFDTLSVPTWTINNVQGSDTAAILAMAQNNPTVFGGSITSGLANITLSYYAYDTVNAVVVENALVTFMTSANATIGTGITDASGYCTAKLQQGATYHISTRNPVGYSWEVLDTITMAAATTQSDTVMGAYTLITASLDTNITTVYGYVVNTADTGIKGATVTFSLSESRIFRDYDSSIVIPTKYTATTNSTGLWTVNVPASNKLFITDPAKDTLWYSVLVSYGSLSTPLFKKIFVPDTTSITFQNVKF
jgi:hypothetical protein